MTYIEYFLFSYDCPISGLNDYVLTKEEIEVLEKFKNNEIEFKEFKIGELFEKIEVNKAKKKDVRKQKDNKYCIPTIYCKMGDNGIMYWGKRGDFTICKDVISIIYNGAIATGKVYIQDEAGILAESYFIKLKNPPVSCNISSINLFLSTVIEKLLRLKYTRDNLATWSLKVENDIISLPLTSSGDINYPYMETLINAVKKLSIKGVVDYKDEVINTTKKVVNKTDDSSKLSSEKLVSFLVSEDDKPQEKDEDISTLNNA